MCSEKRGMGQDDWIPKLIKTDSLIGVSWSLKLTKCSESKWSTSLAATKRMMFGGAQDKDGWTDSHLDPGASRGRCFLNSHQQSLCQVVHRTGDAPSKQWVRSLRKWLVRIWKLCCLMMFHCFNKSVVVGHSWLVYVGVVLNGLNVVHSLSPNLGWWI